MSCEKKLRAGQWVWYHHEKGISQAAIKKIENGICIFEIEGCPRQEIEESKCYISVEEMVKSKNDNKKTS